jgi:hypothetical protein
MRQTLLIPSVALASLLWSVTVPAKVIDIEWTLQLDPSQFGTCGSQGGESDFPCWFSPLHTFTPVTVGLNDVVEVTVQFAGTQSLRWADTGLLVPGLGAQAVGVQLNGGCGAFCGFVGSWETALSFEGARGGLNVNSFSWVSEPATSGISLSTNLGGPVRFTDSYFEFTGIVADIGPFTGQFFSTPDPSGITVDRLGIAFFNGDFSIVDEPGALGLLAVGMTGLLFRNRRRRPTS